MLTIHPTRRLLALTLLSLAPLALTACRAEPPQLTVDVVARFPHDTAAFTEGLLYAHGLLYESTGLVGHSSLREVDPGSGQVIRERDLPAPYFGEGLALVGDRLIQLTYKAGVAFAWDRETFNPLGSYHYQGEGWGLCFDGQSLYMSNGSATLTRRDPDTFAPQGTLTVRENGKPVKNVNELECANDSLYANVWLTDEILRIDKRSGKVTAVIDASPLRAQLSGLDNPDAVLNGIAYDSAKKRFLVTGKLWPTMFQVRFVPAHAKGG
ncbi:MAG TPA: glutaminyl-peptide cyclotransferase [Trueperaceae bacterium]|nr:glutaminyl-peptide cyclotransferase [Trueperaceae bacterium]